DIPSLCTACFNKSCASTSILQNFSISADFISLLNWIEVFLNLSSCIILACIILFLIISLDSPFEICDNLSTSTGGTSIWISILSNIGPESLFLYFTIVPGTQVHSFLGWVKNPQGQGLEAASNKNRAGYVIVPA